MVYNTDAAGQKGDSAVKKDKTSNRLLYNKAAISWDGRETRVERATAKGHEIAQPDDCAFPFHLVATK